MTSKQLESLMGYLRVKDGQLKLRQVAASRVGYGSKQGVTLGSYYRTVTQARKNLRESLVTLLIGLWLGAIRLEDTKRLFDLVGLGARELPEGEEERLAQVLDALLDRMVV